MKEKSNLINTKEKLLKNFSKEQMEIYNYYINKYSKSDEEFYPAVIEDKELKLLENGCSFLTKILKVEVVLGLIVATCIFMFGGFGKENQIKYKRAINPIEIEIKYNPKV